METGRYNYAGALAPERSAYGEAFRRSVGGLVADPTPLVDPFYVRCFRGLVGVLLVRNAHPQPIATSRGYFGDLPADLQPEISTPNPWDVSP